MKEKELRDEFAMAVVGTIYKSMNTKAERIDRAVLGIDEQMAFNALAEIAYQIADACMAEREKKA